MLIWALIVMATVASAAAIAVSRLSALRGATITDEHDVKAVLAADGGIATARVRLAADPTWRGERFTCGGIDVATDAVASSEGWTVTARAGGSVVLEATLVRESSALPRVRAWTRRR
jgi:hypothetical protein